jgi:F-type H+-transporting ATPase subunit b
MIHPHSTTQAIRSAGAAALALGLTLTTPAGLLAAGDGQAPGASLFGFNLGLSFWTVVVFLMLLFILGKFAWGPILSAVEAREERIQNALDESAERQAEAQKLLEEHKGQLADARRQAQEIIGEGKAAGARVRAEIEEKARQEGHQLLERARREIEREKDNALAELRRESVEIALAAATRLMRERMDSDKDRDLVVGYLDALAGEADSPADDGSGGGRVEA